MKRPRADKSSVALAAAVLTVAFAGGAGIIILRAHASDVIGQSHGCHNGFEWDDEARVCYSEVLAYVSGDCELFRATPPHVVRLLVTMPQDSPPLTRDVYLQEAEEMDGTSQFCDREATP